MAVTTGKIQISGLGQRQLAALREQARTLGMRAEDYAKKLVEEGLLLEHQARTKTFDELFAPVQTRFRRSGMNEEELDELVDQARARHHSRTTKKKA